MANAQGADREGLLPPGKSNWADPVTARGGGVGVGGWGYIEIYTSLLWDVEKRKKKSECTDAGVRGSNSRGRVSWIPSSPWHLALASTKTVTMVAPPARVTCSHSIHLRVSNCLQRRHLCIEAACII